VLVHYRIPVLTNEDNKNGDESVEECIEILPRKVFTVLLSLGEIRVIKSDFISEELHPK